MFRSLMVALDGSETAEQALPWAEAVARATGATLHLVAVHMGTPVFRRLNLVPGDLMEVQLRQAETTYLERVADELETRLGSAPRIALISGAPATALCRYATSKAVDVIVMSTHGRGGVQRAWLGSVTDAVIRKGHIPVLVIPPRSDDEPLPDAAPRIRRVLVGVDGSAPAEKALAWGWPLCQALHAECIVVRAVLPPVVVAAPEIPYSPELSADLYRRAEGEAAQYLERVAQRAPAIPGGVRTQVVTGPSAAAALLDAASSLGADLVVVGTRGHGGATRMLLGSVADKVIRRSALPVMVCPPPRRSR
jgi:nucleotide-binding universal stress UspA family protein